MASILFHAQEITGDVSTNDRQLAVKLADVDAAVGDHFAISNHVTPTGTVYFFEADDTSDDAILVEVTGDAGDTDGYFETTSDVFEGLVDGTDYEGLSYPGLLLMVVPHAE